MHSYNRTLLAKLGFADPDKKESRHDLACKYMGLEENHVRATKMILPSFDRSSVSRSPVPHISQDLHYKTRLRFKEPLSPAFEVPISKGDGAYKTKVGFVDVVLPCLIVRETSCNGSQFSPDDRSFNKLLIAVEVKIQRAGMGDILRQLKLYREYQDGLMDRFRLHDERFNSDVHDVAWLLITAFKLSKDDVDVLAVEGIRHARLGEKFDEYVAKQKQADPDGSPEF